MTSRLNMYRSPQFFVFAVLRTFAYSGARFNLRLCVQTVTVSLPRHGVERGNSDFERGRVHPTLPMLASGHKADTNEARSRGHG